MYKHKTSEHIEQKITTEPETVKRLARNSKHTLSSDIIEQIETITPTFKDNKINYLAPITTRLYKSNIKAIAKQYNLNFLVTEPEKVIEFLNAFTINTRKAYYTAIARYIPIARPIDKQDKAKELYLKWLKPKDRLLGNIIQMTTKALYGKH